MQLRLLCILHTWIYLCICVYVPTVPGDVCLCGQRHYSVRKSMEGVFPPSKCTKYTHTREGCIYKMFAFSFVIFAWHLYNVTIGNFPGASRIRLRVHDSGEHRSQYVPLSRLWGGRMSRSYCLKTFVIWCCFEYCNTCRRQFTRSVYS